MYKVYQMRRKQIGIQIVLQEHLAKTATTTTTKTIPAINSNQQ